MRSVALLPSAAFLAGAAAGTIWTGSLRWLFLSLVGLWAVAFAAWLRRESRVVATATAAAYALAGAILGSAATREALTPPIRSVLDAAFGGFLLDTIAPPGTHAPVLARAHLGEDAAPRDFGVSLRADIVAVQIDGTWRPAAGGVRLAVTGAAARGRVEEWRRARVIEAPVTFRRPARYLNEGVPDFERELALGGVALIGSIKSGLLVEVVARGTAFQEFAADVRAHVRAVIQRRVSIHDPVAGAIATAILIGDRTALPDEIRARLQAAGTYHVIAISGGNIAILAALMAGVLLVFGARGRTSALAIIVGLLAYALVVSAGPSVWRATLTAIVYLAARLLDHRSPPWNAMAVSAALLVCVSPLDVTDVGFALTFGATAAILEAARRVRAGGSHLTWVLTSVAASFATELVLLPISANAFSRATAAGLVLNLVAVPLMTLTQIAGLVVVLFDRIEALGGAAGFLTAAAARGLVESARLVDVLPWLTFRVPPPSVLLVATYYATLAAVLWLQRWRRVSAFGFLLAFVALLTGVGSRLNAEALERRLRLTMFDVGQGEAMLLQLPGGGTLMVDTGGVGFDGTAFDIGGRVLAPALWARGVMRLDRLAITHGDPDHAGGALSILRDFAPRELWRGIDVPGHPPLEAMVAAALASGASVQQRLAGWNVGERGVSIRVLHPQAPDWERPRVRNDDSLVLEVRFGDVAILLTGDVSADVERTLLPMLPAAPIRILKVAHHGSRTSTSQALLEGWRPQFALISCGRGNSFGHPRPEVIRRLEEIGARIYRTDRDGQITMDTDGKAVVVRTYVSATKH